MIAFLAAERAQPGRDKENKPLRTSGARSDDRRYSRELIYNGADEVYDFGDDKTQQVATRERSDGGTVR